MANTIKSWHISTFVMFALSTLMLLFSSNLAGGVFFLMMFPAAMWFGYTMRERAEHHERITEERIVNKYRNAASK